MGINKYNVYMKYVNLIFYHKSDVQDFIAFYGQKYILQ